MASRALAAVVSKRALVASRSFHASSLQAGGMVPPLPSFARNAVKSERIPENADAVWDDGVAPELALDFDMPNVSTMEAVGTLGAAFGMFYVLIQGILFTMNHDAAPATLMGDSGMYVDKNWSDHNATPLEKEAEE
mmetsp:Transcript_7495/g.9767  ORF Transcript_7495/g.9767 Transcript_7495/m.9767 type:complete len:136 (-) Transcript_7495:124-531(-)|eukprot:CAMPEP_0198143108 /NCGR_PEP_ID=MMETSP1443-20131203/5792_1 /TAXON_ID=186043 /ORGANISM="Entomoneis sp., Strain CCMP2396" /LENGTH=135 /DNA_ID=CAMNT_0043806251 /DNA_START=104 /DNA_END=511 /DNA_ORIENTATION=+